MNSFTLTAPRKRSTAAGLVIWALCFLAGFALVAYGAFVFGQIWDWFIVPAGVETLPFGTRVGIGLLFNLLVMGLMMQILMRHDENKEADGAARTVLIQVLLAVAYSFAWFQAWLWTFLV